MRNKVMFIHVYSDAKIQDEGKARVSSLAAWLFSCPLAPTRTALIQGLCKGKRLVARAGRIR